MWSSLPVKEHYTNKSKNQKINSNNIKEKYSMIKNKTLIQK